MISRKEKLLVRPWQDRKYENHRRKVQSALPAIDSRPPPDRNHVAIKWKRQQKEKERCRKIENDNFLLLQRLNYVMSTSRVDNWLPPQPKFLSRVGIYQTMPKYEETDINVEDIATEFRSRSRKEKCPACTPQKLEQQKIPEERVPWEAEQVSIRRTRSKSVPVLKKTENILPNIKKSERKKSPERAKTSIPKKTSKKSQDLFAENAQSIILSRGSLKLSINFPSDSTIRLKSGHSEKQLFTGVCYCKNVPGEV